MSTSKLRPKPWETSSVSSLGDMTTMIAGNKAVEQHGDDVAASRNEVPQLPSRPITLKDDLSSHREGPQQFPVTSNAHSGEMFSNGGVYNMPMYGNGYGSMYGNGYGSMYNGGYGSMYGSSHGGMYGIGALTGNNNNAGIAESTQATFHLIESLVGAVNGFAQMLEATYMATHNSFLTMVSVAEQFQYIKEMMGSFFGIFTIIKFLKAILYKITGGKLGISQRKVISQRDGSNVHKLLDEFDRFKAGKSTNVSLAGKRAKRISWKPMLVFLCAVFGFPWLLNKFIAKLEQVQSAGRIVGANPSQQQQLDINNLEFARARYDFVPENPRIECALKKGDLMAIVSKLDPVGNESQWWKVRTKKGDVGYIPSNYIELISRQKEIDPRLGQGVAQSS